LRRSFKAGLLANALLLTGSVSVIAWATGTGPLVLDPGFVSAAPSATALTHDRDEPVSVPSLAAPQPTQSVASLGVAAVPPPMTSQQQQVASIPPAAVTPATSARGKPIHRVSEPPLARYERAQGFRQEMKAGMAALQRRAADCSVSSASLTLAVESVAGGIRILNADVQETSDAARASCLQAALRGQVIPAPSVEPGKRWQMPFAVHSPT
jgi:hypothetical protein